MSTPQLIGGAALAGLWGWSLAALLRPAWSPTRSGAALYLVLLGLALFGLRWDYVVFPVQLVNPDESQMLAQAMAYLDDPVPWRGADGTTSGPLNSYLLTLPALFGLPVGYVSAHVLAQLCGWLTLALGWLALARLAGRPAAGAALLAPATLLALTEHFDFLHYSSERLSMPLLAGALFCLVVADRRRLGAWLAAGVLIGALPLAKMQSAPLAVLFAVVGLGAAWRAGADRRRVRLAAFAAGLASVPVGIVAAAWAGGALHDAWMSYPVMMFHHLDIVSPGYTWHRFLKLVPRFHLYWDAAMIAAVAALALAAAIAAWRRGVLRVPGLPAQDSAGAGRPERWIQLGLAAAYLGVAHYALIRSQRYGTHYALYLFHPFMLFLGIALALASEAVGGIGGVVGRHARAVLGLALVAGTALGQLRPDAPVEPYSREPSPISVALMRHANPGARLVVWGWEPRIFVETGLRMGTRDSITQFSMREGPLRSYYRARLLGDFRESRPEFFVDSVAPGTWMPDEYRRPFETFPELREIVEREFALVEEVALDPDASEKARIYRRKRAAPRR